MSLVDITSTSQLDAILSKSPTKLSIIDFHATWCAPCHMIAPTYKELSSRYLDVNFLKCDVDAAPEVMTRYKVTAMPTFIFLKGSTQVDIVRGANKAALTATVEKHATSSSGAAASFPGKGHSLDTNNSAPAPNAGRSEGILSDIYAYYSGLDPQLKVLLWVLVAYFGFMKLA